MWGLLPSSKICMAAPGAVCPPGDLAGLGAERTGEAHPGGPGPSSGLSLWGWRAGGRTERGRARPFPEGREVGRARARRPFCRCHGGHFNVLLLTCHPRADLRVRIAFARALLAFEGSGGASFPAQWASQSLFIFPPDSLQSLFFTVWASLLSPVSQEGCWRARISHDSRATGACRAHGPHSGAAGARHSAARIAGVGQRPQTGLLRQRCLFHQRRGRQLRLALLQAACLEPAGRTARAGGGKSGAESQAVGSGESGASVHLPGEGGSKSALWLTSKEYWGGGLSGPSRDHDAERRLP